MYHDLNNGVHMPRIILYIIFDWLRDKALSKDIMPVWNTKGVPSAKEIYADDIIFETRSTLFVRNNA